MEQQEYEREIDLKNLLYYVLCRWKLLLVVALLCMAALGGYKYVSAGREQAAEQAPEEKEEQEEEVEPDQLVQDIINGVEDPAVLTGDLLLYYNLKVKGNSLADEIVEKEYQLQASRKHLGELEKQQSEFDQTWQEPLTGEDAVLLYGQKTTLANSILSSKRDIATTEYRIEALKEKIKENEENAAALLETLEETEEIEEEEAAIAANPLRTAVKFAVIGLVGGVFAAAFVLCLIYLFSGKLLDAGALKDMYGLRLLSVIPTREPRKGIDGLIDRLNGHIFRTREEAYDVIYGRMSNLAGELKGKTVLVTGTAEESHVRQLTDYLRGKDGSVNYTVSANPLKNLDELYVFRQADEILLVEQAGKSRLDEIRQELCFIDDVKKKPLGVAVIE